MPSSEYDVDLEADNEDLALLIYFNSLKTDLQREEENGDELEELEDEETEEWEEFGSEDLADGMVDMFLADEDPNDLDWMLQKMQNKAEKKRKTKKGEHSLQGLMSLWMLIRQDRVTKGIQERSQCHEQITEISVVLCTSNVGARETCGIWFQSTSVPTTGSS